MHTVGLSTYLQYCCIQFEYRYKKITLEAPACAYCAQPPDFSWQPCVYDHAYWKQQYTNLLVLTQGQESSQDEKAAAALHAVHLDDQYGGAPVQVSLFSVL